MGGKAGAMVDNHAGRGRRKFGGIFRTPRRLALPAASWLVLGTLVLAAVLLAVFSPLGGSAVASSSSHTLKPYSGIVGASQKSARPAGKKDTATSLYSAAMHGRAATLSLSPEDAFGAVSAASLTRYDNNDVSLRYFGSWSGVTAGAAYGGSYAQTSSTGSSVTVNFYGTSVAWVSWKDRGYGKARLILDGVDKGTVDLYSPSTTAQVTVWTSGTLSIGYHALQIECAGTKNASSEGYAINADAFDVDGYLSDEAGSGVIGGKVTNSSGTGLANVYVTALDSQGLLVGSGISSSAGTYFIMGLPNEPVLVSTANNANYIDEWYNNVPVPGHLDGEGATWLDLGLTDARTGINFSLALGKSISGQLSFTNGVGLMNQEVDAYDLSGNLVFFGTSDDYGAYSITGLPAGQYHIRTAQSFGYIDEWYDNDPVLSDPDASSATVINISSSNATGKNFVLAAGRRILGRIEDSSSTSLADVLVRLQPISYVGASVYVWTDSGGNYSAVGLIPGQYVAYTANDQGYVDEWYDNDPAPADLAGAHANPIDVSSGDQLTINFTLDRGYTISGNVTDNTGGGALAGVDYVEVYNANGVLYAYNEVGGQYGTSYTTWALPAGTYYARTHDASGIGYIDEWYNNKWVGVYDLAGADPVTLSSSDFTGVNFGLDRMTRFEQTDLRLGWAGNWTPATSAIYSGGSFSYANTPGASVTVKFSGVKLDLIGTTAYSYAKMKVTLDGVSTFTVDLYTPTALYKQTIFSTGVLPQSDHTVTIEWTGEKNPASSNTYISLDAVEVAGSLGTALPIRPSLLSVRRWAPQPGAPRSSSTASPSRVPRPSASAGLPPPASSSIRPPRSPPPVPLTGQGRCGWR